MRCVSVGTFSLQEVGDLRGLAEYVVGELKKIVEEAGWSLYGYAGIYMADYIEERKRYVKQSVLHFLESISIMPLVMCFDPVDGTIIANFKAQSSLLPFYLSVCPIPPLQCSEVRVPMNTVLALAYLVDRGERIVKDVKDARLRLQLRDVIDSIREKYGAPISFLVFGLQPASARQVYDNVPTPYSWIPHEPLYWDKAYEVFDRALRELGLPSVRQQLERWKVWSGEGELGETITFYVVDGSDIKAFKHRKAGWIVVIHDYPPDLGNITSIHLYDFQHDKYYNIAKWQISKRRNPHAVKPLLSFLEYIDKYLTGPIIGLPGEKLAMFTDLLGDLYEQARAMGEALGKLSLSDWEDLYIYVPSRDPSSSDTILVYVTRPRGEIDLENIRIHTLSSLMSRGSLFGKLPPEKERQILAKIVDRPPTIGEEKMINEFLDVILMRAVEYAF